MTENYTQYHQVELQGKKAKVPKVSFKDRISGAFSESSREVQLDENVRIYRIEKGKYITVAIRRDGITNVQTM